MAFKTLLFLFVALLFVTSLVSADEFKDEKASADSRRKVTQQITSAPRKEKQTPPLPENKVKADAKIFNVSARFGLGGFRGGMGRRGGGGGKKNGGNKDKEEIDIGDALGDALGDAFDSIGGLFSGGDKRR